jgi:hypothetical protein
VADITFGQLVGLAALVLVLVGAYNTVMNAVKTYRDEKKRKSAPVNTLEETVRQHEERLKKDHERLNNLEEANRIQMRALMAMLHHEIDGNSTDGLKQSYDEIQRYLIEK